MAGSVAKCLLPVFKSEENSYQRSGDHREGIDVGSGGSFWSQTRDGVMSARRNDSSPAAAAPSDPAENMEEDAILRQLNSQVLIKRTEALETLLISVRQNAGRVVFAKKKDLFSTLNEVLVDGRTEVKVRASS